MGDAMEVDTPTVARLTAVAKGKAKITAPSKSVPWVEKYRPTSLADVAAHKDIIDTIDRLTGENRLPHLLLYGPPGTGKTSTILAVARKLYGSQFQNMILELNASDDRGIDVVRQQIQDFASTQSISFGLDATESGLAAIVRLSNGDMRKALNVLQSTHMAYPHITEEAVYLCTGSPFPKDIEQIAYWLLNESFHKAVSSITDLKTKKGLALVDIVRELHPFVFSINMPSPIRVQLINALADIEYRLAFGPNEKLQLGAMVSAFTHTRIALVAAAKD